MSCLRLPAAIPDVSLRVSVRRTAAPAARLSGALQDATVARTGALRRTRVAHAITRCAA
jgi:hypothetical protein